MKLNKTVNIIGAGFAGIETALFLASHGIKVHIFDNGQKSYKCDCLACELVRKENQEENFARELLRKELGLLGSQLIEHEKKFHRDGLVECGCLSSRLLEVGKKLISENDKIHVFNLNVKELDLDEFNLITTGPHTDKDLFEWLKDRYGSMRLFDDSYENAVVDNIDTSLLFKKEDDLSEDFYYPFDYREYINFVNRIVKAHNDYLDLAGIKKIEFGENSIEKLIEKDKDALKNTILRPCKLVGFNERPYAVLRLKKISYGYEVCGFASQMPYILQEQIISSIKPLKNSKLTKEGRVLQNHFINSPYVINSHCMSNKDRKLFFAGGVIGAQGHLEAMATGLIAGYNILASLTAKKNVEFPCNTAIGALLQKIISTNALNSSTMLTNCDIIGMKDKTNLTIEEKKEFVDISNKALNKLKENFYGRNKI